MCVRDHWLTCAEYLYITCQYCSICGGSDDRAKLDHGSGAQTKSYKRKDTSFHIPDISTWNSLIQCACKRMVLSNDDKKEIIPHER